MSLVIPIQVGVSLGARETVTGFAVGGYYRSRPTDEPRQPDGMKTVVPATGRVITARVLTAIVAAVARGVRGGVGRCRCDCSF